jgi:predicted DNA-binding antitoxin AbrB/MazE fold protein
MAQSNPRPTLVVPVVFEDGVLKPLSRLRLKNHERVDIAILSKAAWARAFKKLLQSVHARPSSLHPHEIEEEITRAREEVRKSRRRRRQ